MALLALARQEMKTVVVLLWDNATWHKSARLRQWIYSYTQATKKRVNPGG
jgi:hypothetical protein